MSMTLDTNTTFEFATRLSDEHIHLGVANISEELAVVHWTRRKRPERDIEMEAGNVIRSRHYNVGYQVMRDKLMDIYGMTERELVTALLTEMTPAAIKVRADARQAAAAARKAAREAASGKVAA